MSPAEWGFGLTTLAFGLVLIGVAIEPREGE